MNDALRQELAIAVRCFVGGTTADARRAVASARQLDRNGEVERRLRLIEAGCMVRDRDTASAEAVLATLGRISAEEITYLDRLLSNAPERQFAEFESYRQGLRARLSPTYGAQPSGATAGSAGTPPMQPIIRREGADGLAVTSLILGIVSILASLTGCFCGPLGLLSILIGIVGILLAVFSKRRCGVRTAGLVLSIIGVVLGIVFAVLWFVGIALLGAADTRGR